MKDALLVSTISPARAYWVRHLSGLLLPSCYNPAMSFPQLTSRSNLIINLVGFFASGTVMWFGVFILHLYDATGPKQSFGALILGLDWLLIAVYGLTILYINFTKRKTQQHKDMPAAIKLSSYLAGFLVIFGITALLAVVGFYILLILAFRHWSF